MAESQPIKHSDLVEDGVFNPLIENAKQALVVINQLENQLTAIAKASGKNLNLKVTNVAELQQFNAVAKQADDIDKAHTETIKSKQKVIQSLTIEEQKQKILIAEQSKLNRELAKDQLGLITAYQKASKALNDNRNAYKNLVLAGRENGVVARGLLQTITEQDNRLKKLDATTGQHQRNVDNYTGTIIKLQKGLGGLTGLIATVAAAFGIDTTAMQNLHEVSKELIKTSRELHHVTELGEISQKGNAVAAEENTIATKAQTAASEEQTVATEAQATAQLLLNEVLLLNPAMLAVAAIGALALATTAIIYAVEGHTKAENERSRAIDGSIIRNKELREEYNKSIFELQRMENEYAVLTGTMTESQRAMSDFVIDYEEAVNKIDEDTNKKLEDVGGFWSELFGGVAEQGNIAVQKANINNDRLIAINIENNKLAEKQKIQREKDRQEELKAEQKLVDDELKAREELDIETVKRDAAHIKNEHIKNITLLEISRQNDLRELDQSKADDKAKAAARISINNAFNDDVKTENERWLKDIEKKQSEHEDHMIALYNGDRDAYLKAQQEKFDNGKALLERLNKLEEDNQPDKSDIEKENERYDKALKELDTITQDAGESSKDYQERLNRDKEAIELHHQYIMNGIFAEMRKKSDDAIAKENKEKLAKQKEELEKEINQSVAFQKQLLDSVKKMEDEKNTESENALRRKTEIIDSETNIQSQLFEQGLDNNLDYERKQKVKAQEEEVALEKKKREEEQAQQLSELFLKLQTAYAKDGLAGASRAFAETFGAKAIADQIAGSALEGTEDTGKTGNGGLDGKGGRLWMLHDNERVFTKEQNQKLNGMSNDDVVQKAWAFENIYLPQFNDSIANSAVSVSVPYSNETLLLNGFARLEKTIRNKKEISYELNQHNEWIKNEIQNGIHKEITYKKPRL